MPYPGRNVRNPNFDGRISGINLNITTKILLLEDEFNNIRKYKIFEVKTLIRTLDELIIGS